MNGGAILEEASHEEQEVDDDGARPDEAIRKEDISASDRRPQEDDVNGEGQKARTQVGQVPKVHRIDPVDALHGDLTNNPRPWTPRSTTSSRQE